MFTCIINPLLFPLKLRMLKRYILILCTLSLWMSVLSGQVTGVWRTTDHKSDVERTIVRIYERNGKLFCRVEKLLPTATITQCTGCEGAEKNKSLVGMDIIKDLEKKVTVRSMGKYWIRRPENIIPAT